MAENFKERTIRYLQDAHAAEAGIEETLKGYLNDSHDGTVTGVFQSQLTNVQVVKDIIETRLRELGDTPSTGKGFLNSMLGKLSEIMHGAHDEYDSTTQNLIKAYATNHLKRGMYESLVAYTAITGDTDTHQVGVKLRDTAAANANAIFPLIAGYAKTSLGASTIEGVGNNATVL